MFISSVMLHQYLFIILYRIGSTNTVEQYCWRWTIHLCSSRIYSIFCCGDCFSLHDYYNVSILDITYTSLQYLTSVFLILIHVCLCACWIQRITIEQIRNDEWFQKSYVPVHLLEYEDVNLDEINAAFDSAEVCLLILHLVKFIIYIYIYIFFFCIYA